MSMENQLMILLASLFIQVLMAVAIATVGLLAKRSLNAIDGIQEAVNSLNLQVVGKYYSRQDHEVYAKSLEERMAEFRTYARDGLHDVRQDVQEHEVWLRLLAQKVQFELPAKRATR